MSVWEDYSPDFEEAYDRFSNNIDDDEIFDSWAEKFRDWINESRRMRGQQTIEPTLKQLRALAYHAVIDKGITDVSIQVIIPDKRYRTGFRMGYRDIKTGKQKRDPYKEKRERELEREKKKVD